MFARSTKNPCSRRQKRFLTRGQPVLTLPSFVRTSIRLRGASIDGLTPWCQSFHRDDNYRSRRIGSGDAWRTVLCGTSVRRDRIECVCCPRSTTLAATMVNSKASVGYLWRYCRMRSTAILAVAARKHTMRGLSFLRRRDGRSATRATLAGGGKRGRPSKS